ncbi:hypothetical protein K8T06_12720 [bacterium]|nr:hypothetical protein [bacterium]
MTQVPTAILLGVYGQFWFWDSWSEDFDFEYMDYDMGLTTIDVFQEFAWPVVEGTATGLEFYSALLTPEMTDLIGDFGYLRFGYTDQ